MVLGIPVPAGPSPAVMATFRAANELLDLPPLHPPLVNACDQILTALHRLLTEADGIRAALELDEQLPLLRLIEEAEEMLELEPLEGSLQSRLGAIVPRPAGQRPVLPLSSRCSSLRVRVARYAYVLFLLNLRGAPPEAGY